MHHTAFHHWNKSAPRERIKMLENIGIQQRSLITRGFHNLPPEIKVDLNYAVSKNTAPPDGYSDKSPPWVGAVAVS